MSDYPEWLNRTQHDFLVTLLLEQYYKTTDRDRSKAILVLLDAIDKLALALGHEKEQ